MLARDYLISQGYTVREMNWRIGSALGIDIIAQNGKRDSVREKSKPGRVKARLKLSIEKEVENGYRRQRLSEGSAAYL